MNPNAIWVEHTETGKGFWFHNDGELYLFDENPVEFPRAKGFTYTVMPYDHEKTFNVEGDGKIKVRRNNEKKDEVEEIDFVAQLKDQHKATLDRYIAHKTLPEHNRMTAEEYEKLQEERAKQHAALMASHVEGQESAEPSIEVETSELQADTEKWAIRPGADTLPPTEVGPEHRPQDASTPTEVLEHINNQEKKNV